MSAQIIEFPNAKLPQEWSDAEHGSFVHLTYDGYMSRADAIERVNFMHFNNRVIPGESSDARLLRMARAAIGQLKPRRDAGSTDAA